MTPRRLPCRWRRAPALALTAWAVVALVVWLDSASSPLAFHATRPIVTAGVFGAIWAGISALAGILSSGAAVAASYLASAVGWLAARLASFMAGTGAIFAKVWDGMKIVWSDAVKPAFVWLDKTLTRFSHWLRDTLKPVFDFIGEVKKRIDQFYNTFVRPVIDTIDLIRAINRVLLTFHIDFLQDLDSLLGQLEQRIEEPFIWIRQKLSEIVNVLERVITLDGYFQQRTLMLSLSRYAPPWMNGFWNRQLPADGFTGDPYQRTRPYPSDAKWANGKELAQFFRGEPSRMDGRLAALVPVFRIGAGLDPPDGPEDA